MASKHPQFVNGEIYHLVLRGVGDMEIFKNRDDYFRGIFSIYEFNTTNPVVIEERRRARKKIKKISRGPTSGDSRGPTSGDSNEEDKRDRMVDTLMFCFMPNHIHLAVRQIKEKAIPQLMKKIGTGYASYFNKKYDRKGHLFQGRYRAVHVKNTEQLKTLFVYIHTNPISLIEPRWQKEGVVDLEKSIKFLKDYKWSSYSDYIGKRNFPSVTERNFILEAMGQKEGCREFVESWLKYKKGFGALED